MASDERPPGRPAEPAVPASPPPAAQPAPRKRRRLLIVAIAVVGALFVAGAAGIAVYGIATEPDRSTPTVVVRQFLEASLLDNDVNRVGLFVCRGWPPAEALGEAVAEMNPSIRATWGVTSEQIDGEKADVIARMTFSVTSDGISQRSVETWHLQLVQQDGWRVCDLDRG